LVKKLGETVAKGKKGCESKGKGRKGCTIEKGLCRERQKVVKRERGKER
jgi:hypothetical protein